MGIDLVVPRDGALDLVALGALVHRLDPGTVPFRRAAACQIHAAEFNRFDASDCFADGNRRQWLTPHRRLAAARPDMGAAHFQTLSTTE
jgi:hypothetical protein